MSNIEYFSRDLVQVVSNWQRKARDRKHRYKKAIALEAECRKLPIEFRETSLMCFRQMALDKAGVWKLLGEQELDEQTSSWTQDMSVAKTLFGGVPQADTGLTEVIFALYPKPEQIVVNLKKLLDDVRFQAAVERHKATIDYFTEGLGKYGNDQAEIVLHVGELREDDIWTFGGRSSNFDELVYRTFIAVYGRKPATQEEFDLFASELQEMESQAGARWLQHESAQNVLNRIRPKAETLREIQKNREILLSKAQAEINSPDE